MAYSSSFMDSDWQPQSATTAPVGIRFWLLFCAFWSCAGWILSAVHLLNPMGYSMAVLVGAVLLAVFYKRVIQRGRTHPRVGNPVRRFRRIVPLTFLILGALALLGGALYPPTNYDGLAYRTPRVLHWLAAQHWHWIHTHLNRLNTRACGFEWLSAPMLCLLRTDRPFFLINIACFFLLPGLIFSLSWRLGISRRAAWLWMWALPAGYCFLLQAGSIGNDLLPLPFVLAAMDFALRARSSARLSDLWFSILAAALATGAKANAMPLLLAWVALAFPAWRLLLKGIPGTVALAIVCALVSFVPTAALNYEYCRDWTGGKAENMEYRGAQPWARFVGNSMIVAIDSFIPPIAPFARAWNDRVAPHVLPPKIQDAVQRNFQTSASVFSIGELPTEEGTGLGAGTALLLLVTTAAAFRYRPAQPHRTKPLRRDRALFAAAILVATAIFLVTSFGRSSPRLMAPYFPFLAILLLFPRGHATVARKAWVRHAAVAVSALAALVLILNPARPLFPTTQVLGLLRRAHVSEALLDRANRVYFVYRHRHDAFDPALAVTPPATRLLGMVTFDDPETAMWLPFGSREVLHVLPEDDAQYLRSEGLRYIWVGQQAFQMFSKQPFGKWLEQIHGRELLDIGLELRAAEGISHWALVELE
jgi:hypothetical protein